MAKLIAFDKDHNLQFNGDCKIFLNNLSSMLIVEPKNEDYKMISASYKLKYSRQKNILFVFADFDFLDFCLVFKNEIICQKVYQKILQHQSYQETWDTALIDTRIMIPIFVKIKETPDSELTQIIAKWFNILDENDRKHFIDLLKERNMFEQILTIMPNIEAERSASLKNTRKRKFNEMNMVKNRMPKILNTNRPKNEMDSLSKDHSVTIRYPQFKLLYIPEIKYRRILIIYTSSDCSFIHEYASQNSNCNLFICTKCRTNSSLIEFDENGTNICVKMLNAQHDCDPISNIYENYSEIKFLKRSDYEIVENLSGRMNRLLIVFDSEKREMCHECFWFPGVLKFVCCCCKRSGSIGRNACSATIRNEGKWNEYIELLENGHPCQSIKYVAAKYQHIYKHVLKPNFEIRNIFQQNREMKSLILFDEKDKSLCNIYKYATRKKWYVCHCCRKMGKSVHADLCRNPDGIEYVILNPKIRHVCELKPIPKPDIILQPPKIEYLKETKSGSSKLFIFQDESQKMCHVFTQEKHKHKFNCIGCENLKKKNKSERNLIPTGYLSIGENGNPSFHMKATTLTHFCKPKKYAPEKYQDFKTMDFFYFRDKSRSSQNLKLAIYHPENKRLCFTFGYSNKRFHCGKCCGKKKSLSITVQKDVNNQEYFNHNYKKHVCKPTEVSTISKFIVQKEISQKSSDGRENKANKVLLEEDESKIVKIPNFELQPSQKGMPDKRLVIRHPNDENLCWQYYYKNDGKLFRCYQCEIKKHHATAKVQINADENEKYVILGKSEHICEPLKRQPDIIIKAPNFVIFDYKDDERKPTKLFTFTSETREFCFEFSYLKKEKGFRCLGCYRLKKTVWAILTKNENQEEYVKLNVEHECEPQKFKAEEFQAKTIPESMFQLCPNSNGKENAILLIFTSEKKEFVYSYSANRKTFNCIKCQNRKLRVTAKLRENENGEKFVELYGPEHACKPKKFIPEEYQKKECKVVIIPESMFKLSQNSHGRTYGILTIFTDSEKRNYGYSFHWLWATTYKCYNCSKLNKTDISAKLQTDENGQKYLELKNGDQHICRPQKI